MIYDISYKTLTGSKPLEIRFDKIDRIIRIYDGTRYITLLGTKKYGAVYDRIRFRLKSNITISKSEAISLLKYSVLEDRGYI